MAAFVDKARKETKTDIARNLLRMNMSFDQIIAATGLTREEVEALVDSQIN